GRREDAANMYLDAIQRRPGYKPAAEGAFRVLLTQDRDGKNTRAALDLAGNLQAAGFSDVAAEQVGNILKIESHPNAQDLLAVLVRNYATTALTPEAYKDHEQRTLETIVKKQGSLANAKQEIDRAFLEDFPLAFQLQDSQNPFPIWSKSSGKSDFIALLSSTG